MTATHAAVTMRTGSCRFPSLLVTAILSPALAAVILLPFMMVGGVAAASPSATLLALR